MKTQPLDSPFELPVLWLKQGIGGSWQSPLGNIAATAHALPQGGALDEEAALMANYLVGNPSDMPVLEYTMRGPSIQLQAACTMAITGKKGEYYLGNRPIQMNQTLHLPANSQLHLQNLRGGGAVYIAFAHNKNRELQRFIPREALSRYRRRLRRAIRVVQGPEWGILSHTAVKQLVTQPFQIEASSNRMGLRLKGKLPIYSDTYQEMLSSGVMPGTIQLTSNGQLIILMKEAQTTGGYPRIGQVIYPDLGSLAQYPLGGWLSMNMITVQEATAITKRFLTESLLPYL